MEIVQAQIVGMQKPQMALNPVRESNLQKQRGILSTYCLGTIESIELSLRYLNRKGMKGISKFDLMVLVNSLNPLNSIAAMNESYYDECKKMLVKVAYVYCSIPRESMISYCFDEIATVLRRSHSDITLEEVALAFELAALGKIEANLTSYGAGFNLQMVGDVLKAYKEWKMNIKWGLLELVELVESKQIPVIPAKETDWWCSLVAKARAGGDIPEWRLLPIELLSILNKNGLLDYEGNKEVKLECYIKGIDIYIEELRASKNTNKVVSYTVKQGLEKTLIEIKDWRENGSDLSKDKIPVILRENGWAYGLRLYAVDYIEKMVKGTII